ncbi:hypothetical protein G9F71_004285 [Clostridium sp. FP2]|nr:hypothetical protein [Clostridium sp. FP2]MBZ9622077.1 hypothetical protein [Clostridium sp. FP2]
MLQSVLGYISDILSVQYLGEIACDTDKSYHQFARIKSKAIEKLKTLI